uniref:DNA fragmentation factor subunit alpha n=1 Tax=Anser cygnoides TaxID=8845 RepID=A0A8B9DZ94_ANSCY
MAARPKRCLVRRGGGRRQHGLAASCLRELRQKGEGAAAGPLLRRRGRPRGAARPGGEVTGLRVPAVVTQNVFFLGFSFFSPSASGVLAIDKAAEPITIVLAEDGTIVDDEDYFRCLPPNTKFVALAKDEKWGGRSPDGGTTWLSDVDEVDSAAEKWKQLARQLKDDLSNIILMSEEDLQVLIDVPHSDLAEELAQSQTKIQALQNTLQQVLDRREEERQSKQLLELYLEALKNEGSILSKVAESETVPGKEMDVVDTGTSSPGTSAKTALSDHLLAVLKGKPAPELCLDSQDLEVGEDHITILWQIFPLWRKG